MSDSLALPPPPSEPRPPATRLRRTVNSILGGLGGAAIGWSGLWVGEHVVGRLVDIPRVALPNAAVGLLLVLGSVFVVLLVHELGHIVGGVLAGFRPMLLVVGPLRVERRLDTGGLRVMLNRSLALAGGVAACIPTTTDQLVRRTAWIAAAGPLASVLLTVVAIIALPLTPIGPLAFAWLVIAVASGLIALVTLIPARTGAFMTDGRRVLQLWRGGPDAERDAMQLVLLARDQQGIPIAETPPEWLTTTLTPADGSLSELLARYTAYQWAMAHGRDDDAREQLVRAEALSHGAPMDLDAMLAMEMAFVAAWFDGDASAARALVAPHTRVMQRLPAWDRARYDAAVALAAGDAETVRAAVARGQAAIAASPQPVPGSVQWTGMMLERLVDRVTRAPEAARHPARA